MRFALALVLLPLLSRTNMGQDPGRTSLTNKSVSYTVSKRHYEILARGGITAILVDNSAIDIPELPNHRAGYNGVASLTHRKLDRNLFVPGIAGLNFEHIHDGTTAGLKEKFEPRKFPMELRKVSQHIVEIYQPPTGNWKLESCGRYELLPDGTIEYTFECIPRANEFKRDFIGLFWASYIHQPADKSISFKGRVAGSSNPSGWIKGVTPKHGVDSTHRPAGSSGLPNVDKDFPLTLVNHPSRYEYTDPWYFGVSRKMALIQAFRVKDRVWFAQSPSGGGNGNPAWDFQWFIDKPKIDQTYQMVMRCRYLPFESREQVEAAARKMRAGLR